MLSLLPAAAFANSAAAGSAQQIGDYFEVDDGDGTTPSSAPTLKSGSTQQSYANGKVKVNKIISGTDTENKFNITLEVVIDESVTFEVKEQSGDAAAVLVVDMSASMLKSYNNKYGSRIDAANAAISAFVNKFKEEMGDSTRKIAVVGFGGLKPTKRETGKNGAWTHLNWTDVTESSSISTMVATTNTGTNLQAGILLAKNLLSQKLYNSNGEEITNKSIILLSDGQPTYYIEDSWQHKESQSTSTTVICSSGNHIAGSGSSTSCNCHEPVETLMKDAFFTNINKYAVYIAGNDDELNCTSDSCDLDSDISIQTWLGNVCNFNTILADGAGNLDLGTVFENIATHITLEGTPGLVTDPMGQIIDLKAVEMSDVREDQPFVTKEVNVRDNIMSWNLKEVIPTENDSIKTYTITYTATLDTLDKNFHGGNHYYPTNGVTDLPYGIKKVGSDTLESVGVAFFNIPAVKGYSGGIFKFNKVDGEDQPLAGAEFTLEHLEQQGIDHHTHEWSTTATSDSNGVVTFENIPSGHVYILKETRAPNGYVKSDDEYTVTVSYGKVTVTKNDNDDTTADPVVYSSDNPETFSVANAADVTSITVNKVWADNGYAGVAHPNSVDVQLYADGVAKGGPVNLSADASDPSKNWTYTWSNLPKINANGEEIEYRVEEASGHKDYTVTYSNIENGVITITNTYDPDHGKLKITKTFGGVLNAAPAGFDAKFTVMDSTGNVVEEIDWAEFKDGHYVLEELEPGTYTVTETIKGASPAYTVATSYKVGGVETKQVAVTKGNTAQLDVTNTYSNNTAETISLTVNKVWEDEDTTNRRPSEVQVQLNSSESISCSGSSATLNESNGWSYKFENLPKYANGNEVVYSVEEISISSRYTPSYGSMTLVEGSTNEYILTITNTYQGVEFSIPVYKVVEGENAPEQTFEFDVSVNKLQADPTTEQYVPYNGAVITTQGAYDTEASYSDGKLTVKTNGKGEYISWLYFVLPHDEAQNGKFAVVLKEKNGGAEGWSYDGTEWMVTVDCTSGTPTYSSEKLGATVSEINIQPPTFKNSYENPVTPTPTPTVEPTPTPTAEPTPTPTAEPTPIPTAEPTPRPHRPHNNVVYEPLEFIPKTGDVSMIGYAIAAVIAAGGMIGYKRKK